MDIAARDGGHADASTAPEGKDSRISRGPLRGEQAAVKFSIVTAALNRLAFLRKCTRTVLDPDYGHVEHVVVDGGSTDGSVARWMYRVTNLK